MKLETGNWKLETGNQSSVLSPQSSVLLFLASYLLLLASCAAGDRSVYGDVAGWLDVHALPAERVAVPADAVAAMDGRETVALPGGADAFALLDALDAARPDYVLTSRGVAWDGARAQPWFTARYQPVAEWRDASDVAAPWMLYAYTPSPFDAGARIPLDVAFADAPLALRAYRLDTARITPGAPLHLTLYWDYAGDDFADFTAAVQLTESATGRVMAQAGDALRASGVSWKPDERLAAQYTLVPPGNAPVGTYTLSVVVTGRNGKPLAPSTDTTQNALTLAALEHPPDVSRASIATDYPADFTLGDAIALRGYDAPARLAPGETLRVALLWHALAAPAGDYKIFVHLLAADGQVPVQEDAKPVYWFYPTTDWQPGDYIRDEHVLALPADLPRGDYTLAVGMYDEATAVRLPARAADDAPLPGERIVLHVIQVR